MSIDGTPFVFMEYVAGGDLRGWIGKPRLTDDLPQVLRFAIHLCDGMIHAFSRGIKAHRDIKPGNCLITEDGTLQLTDFGLSMAFDDTDGRLKPTGDRDGVDNLQRLCIGPSQTGSIAGTPPYMAPEQFDGTANVDVRSDIYAFGVVLHEMVTGRLPFVARNWLDWGG